MAVDYTDAQDGVMVHIGKLVKTYDLLKSDSTAISTRMQEILTALEAGTIGDMDAVAEGIQPLFEQRRLSYTSLRGQVMGFALKRLRDPVSILQQIGAISTDQQTVLSRFVQQFFDDSQTVESSVVTLGTVTANGANDGNGTILTTLILDGVTSPGNVSGVNYPAHPTYRDVLSELTVPAETMTLEATTDSYNGATDGFESFAWTGQIAVEQHSIDAEGSGNNGSVTGLHASQIIQNADFETFTTTNTPDNWDIDAGAVTTNILESTAQFYHGTSSLNLLGSGAAAITLSQAVTTSQVTPNKAYCVTVRIKADATIAAGTLTIKFVGTGYTEGSSEKISIAPGSLPTSWTLYSFFVNMPREFPSDMVLQISWSGTPTTAKNVYLDDIALGPVTFGGGVGVVVVRGSTPWVRGDKFTFTVSNTEGVFQRAWRRTFGYQLASDGSPTVADTLAT